MVDQYEQVVQLLLSAALAGIIGLERERHGRAAGLRTHILVAVGSCLIMLSSEHIFGSHSRAATCDPGRIAAGVVTGIGFLGAGTILRYRGSVIGLTTAASIWVVAAIGLSIGARFYEGALVTTGISILTLWLIGQLEHRIIRKDWYKSLVIESHIDHNMLQRMRSVLSDYRAEIRNFEIEKIDNRDDCRLLFDIKLTTNKYDDTIIIELLKLDGVNKAHWE